MASTICLLATCSDIEYQRGYRGEAHSLLTARQPQQCWAWTGTSQPGFRGPKKYLSLQRYAHLFQRPYCVHQCFAANSYTFNESNEFLQPLNRNSRCWALLWKSEAFNAFSIIERIRSNWKKEKRSWSLSRWAQSGPSCWPREIKYCQINCLNNITEQCTGVDASTVGKSLTCCRRLCTWTKSCAKIEGVQPCSLGKINSMWCRLTPSSKNSVFEAAATQLTGGPSAAYLVVRLGNLRVAGVLVLFWLRHWVSGMPNARKQSILVHWSRQSSMQSSMPLEPSVEKKSTHKLPVE